MRHATVIVCDPCFSKICLSTGYEYSRTEFPLSSEHHVVSGWFRAGAPLDACHPHDCFSKEAAANEKWIAVLRLAKCEC
jgi:hypothetical protein